MLTNDELLTTTRTVRKRLDLERPVPRSVIEDALRVAFQAPTGANAQNWLWVVVDDPAIKQAMSDIYHRGMARHGALHPQPALSMSGYSLDTLADGVAHLNANLHRVPVLMVPAYRPRYGTGSGFAQAALWGSLLPAVWNFMLALRVRGLGAAWTTVHLHCHDEMADLLNMPRDFMQAGLFPVAYTIGTSFKPANRAYSERRIFWNRCSDVVKQGAD
jgi:nitroreductase